MTFDSSDTRNGDGSPESGKSAGSRRGRLPWPGSNLSSGIRWGCRVGGAVLVIVLGLVIFESTGVLHFKSQLPFLGLGSEPPGVILVGTPKIYTRERLINARLRQREWLEEQFELTRFAELKEAQRKNFAYLNYETVETLQRHLQALANVGEGDGESANRAGQPLRRDAPGQNDGAPGSQQAQSQDDLQSTGDNTLPTDLQYEALSAFRQKVEHEWLKTQLDDRHDIDGNTIYQLAFDVALLVPPEKNVDRVDKVGVIHVQIKKPPANAGSDRGLWLYELWLDWREQLEPVIARSIENRHKVLFGMSRPNLDVDEIKLTEFLEESLAEDPYAQAALLLLDKKAANFNLIESQDKAELIGRLEKDRKLRRHSLLSYVIWFGNHQSQKMENDKVSRQLSALAHLCFPERDRVDSVRDSCQEHEEAIKHAQHSVLGSDKENTSKSGASNGQSNEYEFDLHEIPQAVYDALRPGYELCEALASLVSATGQEVPSRISRVHREFCSPPPRAKLSDRLMPLLALLEVRNFAWQLNPGPDEVRIFPFLNHFVWTDEVAVPADTDVTADARRRPVDLASLVDGLNAKLGEPSSTDSLALEDTPMGGGRNPSDGDTHSAPTIAALDPDALPPDEVCRPSSSASFRAIRFFKTICPTKLPEVTTEQIVTAAFVIRHLEESSLGDFFSISLDHCLYRACTVRLHAPTQNRQGHRASTEGGGYWPSETEYNLAKSGICLDKDRPLVQPKCTVLGESNYLGLQIFRRQLEQKYEVYAYDVKGDAVRPGRQQTGRDETIDVGAMAALSGNIAGKVAGTLANSSRASQFAVSEEVVGYSVTAAGDLETKRSKSSNGPGMAAFGWMIVPRNLQKGGIRAYPVNALVSVPSWWRALEIDVGTCWVDAEDSATLLELTSAVDDGSLQETTSGAPNPPESESSFSSDLAEERFRDACGRHGSATWDIHEAMLPGDARNVSHKLRIEVVDEPNLQEVGIGGKPQGQQQTGVGLPDASSAELSSRVTVTAGRPAQIVLIGARLWRNPRVFLGNQSADSIQVLPDMRGLVAQFRCIDNPNQYAVDEFIAANGSPPTNTAATLSGDGGGLGAGPNSAAEPSEKVELPIRVWTSEGRTLPLSVIVQRFVPQRGEPACFLDERLHPEQIKIALTQTFDQALREATAVRAFRQRADALRAMEIQRANAEAEFVRAKYKQEIEKKTWAAAEQMRLRKALPMQDSVQAEDDNLAQVAESPQSSMAESKVPLETGMGPTPNADTQAPDAYYVAAKEELQTEIRLMEAERDTQIKQIMHEAERRAGDAILAHFEKTMGGKSPDTKNDEAPDEKDWQVLIRGLQQD